MQKIGAPMPGEYAPAFDRYVARVRAIADPLEELSAQRGRLLTRLSPLTEEQARIRYAPDDWTSSSDTPNTTWLC